jgi:hypothetical protein
VYTGDSTTAVAREQSCGHVISQATTEHAIMEKKCSMRSVSGLYSITRTSSSVAVELRVEAGLNTSSAGLRVLEGDEKGTECLGV